MLNRDLDEYFKKNYNSEIRESNILNNRVLVLLHDYVYNFDSPPHFRGSQISIARVGNVLHEPKKNTADNLMKEHINDRSVSFHCPVCLDTFSSLTSSGTKILAIACGHVFCKPCIKNKSIQKCPVCKTVLSDYIPLYF